MKPYRSAGLATIAGMLVLGVACHPKTNQTQQPQPAAQAAQPSDAAIQLAMRIADSMRVADSIANAPASLALEANADGQSIFRHDTFGNERFWTDSLRMHEIIQQKLDPTTALQLGLKVDAEALPAGALESADLKSPATTLVLLKANAIVGLKAFVDDSNHLTRVGVTCALCHSTVDNSVQEGIGRRIDGAPNRQLNVGAILALSSVWSDEQRTVFNSWGPGKYDPWYNQDGMSFPVVIPPAYGLAQVENVTYTAEGTISYWNSYVAVTQMHGVGRVVERDGNAMPAGQSQAEPTTTDRGDAMAQRGDSMPQSGDSLSQRPETPAPHTAQENNQNQSDKKQSMEDFVTPKLPALRDYQHSLDVPAAAESTFDHAAATRGERVFRRACMSCHVGVTGTDNNSTMQSTEVTPGGDVRDGAVKGKLHAPAETGMDAQYANRTTNKAYRTTPLRGLWQHAPYFHDGSAATLADVVTHYNKTLKLKLTTKQQKDLVEFLKSK